MTESELFVKDTKQAKINSNTYLKIAIGTPAIIPKGTKLSDVLNYVKRIWGVKMNESVACKRKR